MLILMLCLLFQEEDGTTPELNNALVYMRSGEVIEAAAVRVQGAEDEHFELKLERDTVLVSIFRIARIRHLKDRKYEITYDSGEVEVGELRAITFEGQAIAEDSTPTVTIGDIGDHIGKDLIRFPVRQIDRIHFVNGRQLRSCEQGHYERYTPYPFCPVCGRELLLGPYTPMETEEERRAPANFRLRVNPRDPSSRGGG